MEEYENKGRRFMFFWSLSTDSILTFLCGVRVISLVSGGMKLATGRARVEDDNQR